MDILGSVWVFLLRTSMHIERHSLSGPPCVDTASTKDEDTCTLVVRRTVRVPTSDEMTTHYCRARTRADAAPSAHISLPAKSLTNGARGKWVRNVRTSTQAERARKGYGPLHIPPTLLCEPPPTSHFRSTRMSSRGHPAIEWMAPIQDTQVFSCCRCCARSHLWARGAYNSSLT